MYDTMADETSTPPRHGAGRSGASDEAVRGSGNAAKATVAPGSPAGAVPTGGGDDDALHDKVLRVQEGVDKLLERFDEKLLHDEARTNEIKRLNAELAKHQPDAKWSIAHPYVVQMIRHLDEIQRFVQRYESRDDATAKDFVNALEWLGENIELALEEHGVTAYRPQVGKDPFDGRRHSVVGDPVPTTDPSLSRVIERCVRPGFERVRPGFERDGMVVVARAAVRIYRHGGKQDRQ